MRILILHTTFWIVNRQHFRTIFWHGNYLNWNYKTSSWWLVVCVTSAPVAYPEVYVKWHIYIYIYIYIQPALWLLMSWCFSTRSSVAIVLRMHPSISSCLCVNEAKWFKNDLRCENCCNQTRYAIPFCFCMCGKSKQYCLLKVTLPRSSVVC